MIVSRVTNISLSHGSYPYNMANNETSSLLTIMPSLRLFNLEIPNPLAMLSGTSKSSDSKPLPHNDDAEMDYCMPSSCSVSDYVSFFLFSSLLLHVWLHHQVALKKVLLLMTRRSHNRVFSQNRWTLLI